MTLVFTNWRRLETGEASAPAAAYRAVTAPEPLPPTGEAASLRPAPTETSADDLDELENEQLVLAWTAGAHQGVSMAAVLANPEPYFEDMEDILEHQLGAPIEWWDVVDAETQETRYVLVLWGNDCGQLYAADSTEGLAYVAQFALWCEKDWALWKALVLAHRVAKRHYPSSELARMFFAGSFVCPMEGCRGRATLWTESDADEGPCSKCGAPVPARDY